MSKKIVRCYQFLEILEGYKHETLRVEYMNHLIARGKWPSVLWSEKHYSSRNCGDGDYVLLLNRILSAFSDQKNKEFLIQSTFPQFFHEMLGEPEKVRFSVIKSLFLNKHYKKTSRDDKDRSLWHRDFLQVLLLVTLFNAPNAIRLIKKEDDIMSWYAILHSTVRSHFIKILKNQGISFDEMRASSRVLFDICERDTAVVFNESLFHLQGDASPVAPHLFDDNRRSKVVVHYHRYGKHWDDNNIPISNAKQFLENYVKPIKSLSPRLGRLFSRHWGRSSDNIKLVKSILKTYDDTIHSMEDLLTCFQDQNIGNGSLARRLEFLKAMSGYVAPITTCQHAL